MKSKLLLLIFCLSIGFNIDAKKKDSIIGYDIEYSGAEGVSGSCMIQVWINTSKATLSTEEFKRYAVEGIFFSFNISLPIIPSTINPCNQSAH